MARISVDLGIKITDSTEGEIVEPVPEDVLTEWTAIALEAYGGLGYGQQFIKKIGIQGRTSLHPDNDDLIPSFLIFYNTWGNRHDLQVRCESEDTAMNPSRAQLVDNLYSTMTTSIKESLELRVTALTAEIEEKKIKLALLQSVLSCI